MNHDSLRVHDSTWDRRSKSLGFGWPKGTDKGARKISIFMKTQKTLILKRDSKRLRRLSAEEHP